MTTRVDVNDILILRIVNSYIRQIPYLSSIYRYELTLFNLAISKESTTHVRDFLDINRIWNQPTVIIVKRQGLGV